MKIGILTFHHGINHGGFLQAYALQNTLKELGYENKIINYRNVGHLCKKYKLLFFTPRLLNNSKKWLKFRNDHKRLHMSRFALTVGRVDNERFDVIILGSDEIWNFENSMFGFDPIYFGIGLNAKKVIAYAASFGNVDVNGIIPDKICGAINNLQDISVRDENSQRIVSKITGKDFPILLDPTFLYDFKGKERGSPYSDFILVYGNIRKREQIDRILSFARSQNRKTISVAYKNSWCDINIVSLDAFEWLAYFKKASMVITSMFHGTVFSIKYNKPFCIIVTPYRKNKFEPTLRCLGLSSRVLGDDNPLEEIFNRGIEFDQVNVKINKMVDESVRFIEKAISLDHSFVESESAIAPPQPCSRITQAGDCS